MEIGSDSGLHLRHNHHYYTQVQGEIAILGVEWCDFVVYSNRAVIVDCILADVEYWSKLEQPLEDFYVHHVIPEILSRKIFMEENSVIYMICCYDVPCAVTIILKINQQLKGCQN